MRRKVTLASTVAIGCLATALWTWSHGHNHGGLASMTDESTGSAPSQVAPRPSPVNGSEYETFRFTRTVHATMGSQDLVEMRLKGKIWIQHPEGGPDLAFVKTESLESPQGKMGELPLMKIDLASNQLSCTDCAKTSAEASHFAGRFARDVLDQFRFFEKFDLQGAYEATVTKIDERHFQKIKTRYLVAPFSSGKITRSHHRLMLDANGHIETIEGLEDLLLGADQTAVRTAGRYKIQKESNPKAPPYELTQLNWHEITLSSEPTHGESGSPSLPTSETPSLSELLAMLQGGALKSGEERLGWFRQLVKRLNVEPGRLELVRKVMPDLRSKPDEFKLLVGAMAAANQQDANAALIEASQDDRYSEQDRALIMNTWIATDAKLTSETTTHLMKLAADPDAPSDQAQSAMLALGAQVAKFGGNGGGERIQIEKMLITKLQTARNEADSMAALDAMGNSGALVFLPYIQNNLTAPSEHIRAHAYLALRLIPGADVAALLNGGHSDPSGEVQNSLQLALNMRNSGE